MTLKEDVERLMPSFVDVELEEGDEDGDPWVKMHTDDMTVGFVMENYEDIPEEFHDHFVSQNIKYALEELISSSANRKI